MMLALRLFHRPFVCSMKIVNKIVHEFNFSYSIIPIIHGSLVTRTNNKTCRLQLQAKVLIDPQCM